MIRVAAFTILLMLPSGLFAETLLAPDKAAHFGLAFSAQVVCAALGTKVTDERLWSNVGCFALTNAVGVIKETTDQARGGTPEKGDVVANLLGTGLGGLIFQFGF